MKGASVFLAVVAVAAMSAGAQVLSEQTLTLKRGWNALYMEVSPTQTLDEVFADWPVTSVGFYDPAAFLATRQFAKGYDTEGLSATAISMWRRDFPDLTEVKSIPPGSVCIAFNTNKTASVVMLKGVSAAPRITWHVTDTNEVYNYVGFSLQQGAKVLPMDYLEGFAGASSIRSIYSIGGNSAAKSPTIAPIEATTKVADGDVLLVASTEQSDWSGVLNVSPMHGLDFGSESTKQTLTIRNDGKETRTVAIDAILDPSFSQTAFEREYLHIRDGETARTNGVWTACDTGERIAQKELSPDDEWVVEFGLDRSNFASAVKGLSFGALLRITDIDGKSKMRVDVPLTGETSGGTAAGKAWPGGLWVADVEFNQIIAPGGGEATKTGGAARLRLPIHIDATGKVRLLQRVASVGALEADGVTYDYHLYAGTAEIPSTASVAMRISAVCLPTETPVVEGAAGSAFSGDAMVFEFTVAGDGATSLLRHPLHPQHDGLRWDFATAAPSGDDFQNYKLDVKPETFSVSCRIDLRTAMDGGEAVWNPESSKSGTCRWTFSNLMRQGDVVVSGPMTLRRVSPLAELILE